MLSNTRVTPTFLLKGVDAAKLLEDYKNGVYAVPDTREKAKIKICRNSSILAPTYGKSSNDPVYSIKDKNNNNVVIATSGHSNYEVFTTNGGQLEMGGRCDHCKQDFETIVLGYPVAYQERLYLMDKENPVYKTMYIFWIEGELCSFECALAKVRETQQRSCEYRDNSAKDSESMLKMLYRFMYPNEDILRPAQPYRLLKENKGSLTMDEWKNIKHVYQKTDKILMIPVKIEYIQESFIKPIGVPVYTL